MLLPWIYSYVEDSIETLMDGIQQKINKPSHQSSYSDRKAHHFDLKNTSLNQASASGGEIFQFLFQPLTDEKQTALYRSHRQS